MGVPKFWRWLTERYPMINIDVDDHSLPEIDNLYLDLNGLVHMSTHSNSLSGLIPHLAPAPPVEEGWSKIFAYIEMILQMTKPRKLIYFAIDGVAPVAKCCQQRTRRYKHVHEVEEFVEKERKEGRAVVDDWFDSSCITQGTDFMEALSEQVEFFIKWKFATDENWRGLEILVSGGNVPGEGEHKILNYLRHCGSEPNLHHCIYGLDADLILLGLSTHQPFISVLREDVNITYVRSSPERSVLGVPPGFKVLYINLLREYMQAEVVTVPGLDLEQFIDDFVMLSLFMGNDFLPRTPTFEIGEGALDFLIEQYKAKWATTGYLTNKGVINWGALAGFMEGLIEFEDKIITERIENRGLYRRPIQPPLAPSAEERPIASEQHATPPRAEPTRTVEEARESREDLATQELKARLKAMLTQGIDKVKSQYYLECLRQDMESPDGPAAIHELAVEYLRGLQWVLCYYYRGCPDWEWFYPSHYCPMANELQSALSTIISEADGGMIPFKNRGPIQALEQLLIVLPRKTKKYVPSEIAELYNDPVLAEYFPNKIIIEYDIMCAAVNWHSIKLILPFPNVTLIREKMQAVTLSPTSIRKNQRGQERILRYDVNALPTQVQTPNVKCKNYTGSDGFSVPLSQVLLDIPPTGCFTGRIPEGSLNVLPGMPSLEYINCKKSLKDHGVNVFGNFSKLPSLNLEFSTIFTELDAVYTQLFNKTVYVNYPIQQLALVVSVSDASRILPVKPDGLGANYADVVENYRQNMVQFFRNLKNIEVIPDLHILVHVQLLRRVKKTSHGKYEPEWEDTEKVFPLELVMLERDLNHHLEGINSTSLADEFPRGSKVIVLNQDYFGSLGTVVDYCSDANWPEGGLEVLIEDLPLDIAETCKEIVKTAQADRYFAISEVAKILDCPQSMVSTLVGNFRMRVWSAGKSKTLQIGLNLKNERTMTQIQGWARWGEYWNSTSTEWEISSQALQIMQSMKREFPLYWDILKRIKGSNRRRDSLDFRELFSYVKNPEIEVERLALWVMNLPCSKLPWASIFSDNVPESALKAFATLSSQYPRDEFLQARVQLNPGQVYKPAEVWAPAFSEVQPKFELGDRVRNLNIFNKVVRLPFGAEGTVVAVYDTLYVEVLFDRLQYLQGPVLVDTNNLLNLTAKIVSSLRKEEDILPYRTKARHTDFTFKPENILSKEKPQEEAKLEPSLNIMQSRVHAEEPHREETLTVTSPEISSANPESFSVPSFSK